ncbi:MAG: hypothetical protein LBT83_06950 [Tannerella sp.]|jgi:hypothetical protein|nr:hypothetical protein [Tannerella sp.]
MNKRSVIQNTLFALMGLVGAASIIFYFVLRGEKPWLAFYVACCGGVLIVNLIIVLLFVRKNVN